MEGLDAGRVGEVVAQMLARHQESVASVAAQCDSLARAAKCIVETAQSGGKVFACGNGGSAADAQHLAAELTGRFEGTAMSMPCVSLAADISVLTALANDYGYEQVFQRQVAAAGKPGDVLVAISTSGASLNVLLAARAAHDLGMSVVALTGAHQTGNTLGEVADILIACECNQTPRIQEAHTFAIHAICELVRHLRLNSNQASVLM